MQGPEGTCTRGAISKQTFKRGYESIARFLWNSITKKIDVQARSAWLDFQIILVW